MNGLGPKLLVVCLSGMLALPVGFCCGAATKSAEDQAASTHCCRTPQKQSQGQKAKLAKSCCCQERVNATVAAKPLKRTLALSLPATPPSSTPHLGNAWGVVPHAFFEPGEHSFQSLFCVWRC